MVQAVPPGVGAETLTVADPVRLYDLKCEVVTSYGGVAAEGSFAYIFVSNEGPGELIGVSFTFSIDQGTTFGLDTIAREFVYLNCPRTWVLPVIGTDLRIVGHFVPPQGNIYGDSSIFVQASIR